MARYSFSGPSIDSAVLHHDDESYASAIASGHKDTYAPEAWEENTREYIATESVNDEAPSEMSAPRRGRPPKNRVA